MKTLALHLNAVSPSAKALAALRLRVAAALPVVGGLLNMVFGTLNPMFERPENGQKHIDAYDELGGYAVSGGGIPF